jgi:hypothetical protein
VHTSACVSSSEKQMADSDLVRYKMRKSDRSVPCSVPYSLSRGSQLILSNGSIILRRRNLCLDECFKVKAAVTGVNNIKMAPASRVVKCVLLFTITCFE